MDRAHMENSFLEDLRKAHEVCSGGELSKILHKMRKRLDDPAIISADNVYNLLISFREIQDYNAMINLVGDLHANIDLKFACTPNIHHLYAFALNRRNQNGDREMAEKIINNLLEEKENHNTNTLCLLGRIYKDKFVESGFTDMESLDKAIVWYRKGFDIHPNEYAGINLTTLLVIKGNELSNCPELQRIALTLNNLTAVKGNLEAMKNYWDVATVFEMCVLSKNFTKAILAANCMFRLKPAKWCLKSTLGNLSIVNHFKPVQEEVQTPELSIFNFWIEFFTKATEEMETNFTKFPVLVLTSLEDYKPSYISLNVENKSCDIASLCLQQLKEKCTECHEWSYGADSIKNVSVTECDGHLLLLCLHRKSEVISVIFPSTDHCKKFFMHVQEIFPDISSTVIRKTDG